MWFCPRRLSVVCACARVVSVECVCFVCVSFVCHLCVVCVCVLAQCEVRTCWCASGACVYSTKVVSVFAVCVCVCVRAYSCVYRTSFCTVIFTFKVSETLSKRIQHPPTEHLQAGFATVVSVFVCLYVCAYLCVWVEVGE